MIRPYNFGPGPAQMPEDVLKLASNEMMDWKNTGMSSMELGHRGKDFSEIIEKAADSLSELLELPPTHKVLFMQGGARAQNAIIPLNLLKKNLQCDYVVTGYWSEQSLSEASTYGFVNVAASTAGNFTSVPSIDTWNVKKNTSYVHLCSNETVHGVEFPNWPDMKSINRENVPLVVDMTSNILSKKMDFSKLGLAYASAQKNIGSAGLTVVIIDKSLPKEISLRGLNYCPKVFDYLNLIKSNSLYNTPPTYGIYIAGLMFDWLIGQGGLKEIEKINFQKSKLVYDTIDSSDFYTTHVDIRFRSRINIPFFLPSEDLVDGFVEGAKEQNLINLRGHKAVGGLRANLYNSMPIEGVEALVDWLIEYEKKNG